MVKLVSKDGLVTEITVSDEATVQDIIVALREKLDISPQYVLEIKQDDKPLTPTATIGSLNLDADDFLKYEYVANRRCPRTNSKQGLFPRRSDIDLDQVSYPADFNDRVEKLIALDLSGATREDIENALKDALFDVDRAAEYLMARVGEKRPLIKSQGPRLTTEQRAIVQRLYARAAKNNANVNMADIVQFCWAAHFDEESAAQLLGL